MEKLDSRKEALLETLVREYVKTAEPVGSLHLAERAGLDISAATVRNELSELEESGYLIQPHTSAGRVPTEAAYRYFVEHLAHRGTHKGTAPLSNRKRGLSPSETDGELSDVFGARTGAIAARHSGQTGIREMLLRGVSQSLQSEGKRTEKTLRRRPCKGAKTTARCGAR